MPVLTAHHCTSPAFYCTLTSQFVKYFVFERTGNTLSGIFRCTYAGERVLAHLGAVGFNCSVPEVFLITACGQSSYKLFFFIVSSLTRFFFFFLNSLPVVLKARLPPTRAAHQLWQEHKVPVRMASEPHANNVPIKISALIATNMAGNVILQRFITERIQLSRR